jgi:opacity protein-like surface antigen
LGAHLKIGTLPLIDLEISAEYAWKKKENILYYPEELEGAIPLQVDMKVKDLSLNATAKYHFSFPVVKPYVGAGVGIHRMLYQFSAGDTSVIFPEDENKIGFHGVGGLSFKIPVFPLEVFAEGRFVYIKTEQKKLDTKETDFITILAGVTLNL